MFRHSFNSVGGVRVRSGVVGWLAVCAFAIAGVVNVARADPPEAPVKVETVDSQTSKESSLVIQRHHYKDGSYTQVTHYKGLNTNLEHVELTSYKHWEYIGEDTWVLTDEGEINPAPEDGEEESARPWEKGGNPLDPNAFEEGPIFKAMTAEQFMEKFGIDGKVQGKGDKDPLINPADDNPRGTIPSLDKPKKKPLDPEKELSPDKLGLDLQETSLLNDIGLAGVLTPGYTLDQLINPDPFEQKKPDVPVPGQKPGSGPAPDDGDKAPGGPGPEPAPGRGVTVTGSLGKNPDANGAPNIHDLAVQSLVNPDPFPMGGFGAAGGFSPEGFGNGDGFYGEGGGNSYSPPGQGSTSGKPATSNSLPKLSASALKYWSSLSVKRPSRPAPSFKPEAVERRPVSKPNDPTIRRPSMPSFERPLREVHRPIRVDRSPSLERANLPGPTGKGFQRVSGLSRESSVVEHRQGEAAVRFIRPQPSSPRPR